VPAWGEGTVAFNADKNEEFSTPPRVHLVLQGYHHHYSHDTITVTVIDKDGKEIERFQITNLNN
jgi:hypothetical protein